MSHHPIYLPVTPTRPTTLSQDQIERNIALRAAYNEMRKAADPNYVPAQGPDPYTACDPQPEEMF